MTLKLVLIYINKFPGQQLLGNRPNFNVGIYTETNEKFQQTLNNFIFSHHNKMSRSSNMKYKNNHKDEFMEIKCTTT